MITTYVRCKKERWAITDNFYEFQTLEESLSPFK